MPQTPDKKIPLQGVDMDSDELRLPQNKASFQKNLTFNVNKNASSPAGEGNNFGVLTPFQGNQSAVTDFNLPSGYNTCIGSYESKETNEVYFFIHNSNELHTIYRLEGNGGNRVVYQGSCLNFSKSPEYGISEGRCELRVIPYTELDGSPAVRKLLVFTDNLNPQRFISTEDSILTNNFTVPYFNRFTGYDCSPCYLINLGVAPSLKCISVTPITQTDEDETLPNLMINKGWQWRIRYVDRFYRQSEPGIISDRYFVVTGQNCIQTNPKLPRCVDLTIDAGCAWVEKIEIWFRNCANTDNTLSPDTDWFLYDTIEKYSDCSGNGIWYERDVNDALPYSLENNQFTYRFCGDKECQPIAREISSRTENPLPLTSSGLAGINQEIMLSNNVRGFEPLSCDQLDNISYSATDPAAGCENSKLVNIQIYVPIYNPKYLNVSALWVYDQDNPTIFYGQGTSTHNPRAFGQFFVPGLFGFLGYFAGTSYTSQSKQVTLELHTGRETYMGFPKFPTSTNVGPAYSRPASTGTYVYQKFEFNVPPGKYSFRIGSPGVTVADGYYQKTSTTVWGQCKMDTISFKTSELKELIIDCCDGEDIRLSDPDDTTLSIYDMSFGPFIGATVMQDSQTRVPIEFVPISEAPGTMVYTPYSDHNGFFFGASLGLISYLVANIDLCIDTQNLVVNNPGGSTYDYYDLFTHGPGEFPVESSRLIEGDVKTCDGSIGIAGSLVVAIGAQPTLTDSTGHFKIILHQRTGGLPIDTFILSQSGGCVITNCEDACNRCFEDKTAAYKACDQFPNRGTVLAPWLANILGNDKGPENGGRYGMGITMHDWMGRHGFIQASEEHYVSLKDVNETHSFAFSTIQFTLSPDIVFPTWVRYITFSVTKNLNHDDYLSWVADRVEFIDNAGNINTGAPVKIRIYYESLAEFNKQNGFATNTNWQFLVNNTDGTKISRAGDRVQFILNGDGEWFAKNISAQVTYDQEGKYFDIEYSDDLKDLKDGALIKLIRLKDCITTNVYYETCSTVRVNNGIPEVYTGTINVFDSYFLNRQIPIPYYDTNDGETKRTVISTYFSYFFESNSPSDRWGSRCANTGRPNVKNPYERQKRFGSEIARSKALLNNSNFNGLSYYSEDDIQQFPEQEWGNIVVALVEVNTVLVICEYNNFLIGFNDSIPTINEENQLVVSSGNNRFGAPQRKIGSDYGCQPRDINTIRKYQGYVIYLDKNRFSLLQHNFSEARNISIMGYKGYLNQKIRYANGINNEIGRAYDQIFLGGINPENGEYYLTAFAQKRYEVIPPASYINEEKEVRIDVNETICLDIVSGILKTFASFTPEYYATLNGYNKNRTMITMREGIAWVHIVPEGNIYNNFYTIQCKKVIQLISNIGPEKVKRFMFSEVYCKEHKFIADTVLTESNQISRIPSAWWEYRGKFWCAAFLCDINTFQDPNTPIIAVAPLTDGNMLNGRWCKVTYISEDADDSKYCELDGVIAYVTGVEKSGD